MVDREACCFSFAIYWNTRCFKEKASRQWSVGRNNIQLNCHLHQSFRYLRKWMKGKNYLLDLKEKLNDSSDNFLSYKYLESIRGFFYHLAITFGILFLYLKGFHRTLCSHLPKRDEEGYKRKDLEWIGHLNSLHSKKLTSREDIDDAMGNLSGGVPAPRMIKVFPRFHQCLRSLLTLISWETGQEHFVPMNKRITWQLQ